MAAPGYHIIVGSYLDREIALRELAEFSSCKQPLFVAPIQGDSGEVHYRVIDGPYRTYNEAEIIRQHWLSCGLTDAWITGAKAAEPRSG